MCTTRVPHVHMNVYNMWYRYILYKLYIPLPVRYRVQVLCTCTDLPGCTLHVQSTSHGKYLQGTGSVVGDNTGTKLLYSAYVHATGIRAVFLELPTGD